MKKLISVLLTVLLLAVPFCSFADTDVTIGVTGAFYEDLWQPAIDQLKTE